MCRLFGMIGSVSLVLLAWAGCGPGHDKNCGESCVDNNSCRSGYICNLDGSVKNCVPSGCADCSGGQTCNYSTPDNAGDCVFDSCK